MHPGVRFGYDADRASSREETMAEGNATEQIRSQLLNLLLDKVDEDAYPSSTMLDIIEQMVTEETAPAYAEVLMAKINDENYPSMSLVRRVLEFAW